MPIILFFLVLLIIGGVTGKLILNAIAEKNKNLNLDTFNKHTHDLEELDKNIRELESKGIKNYANEFVWKKFKTAPITILSLILPTLMSLVMFGMGVPMITNIFSALVGMGMLGLAFWWYRIHKVYEYAKVGSEKYVEIMANYKKEYVDIEYNKIKSAFQSLGKTTEFTMKATRLLYTFNKEYEDLVNIINKQQIINNQDKTIMLQNVDSAFKEGISLFKEIFDILLVEDKIDESHASNAVLEKSNQNKEDLKELFEVLSNLIESLSLTSLDIPKATSSKKSVDVATEAMNHLKNSMDQARNVQENVRNMSYGYNKSTKYKDISTKYEKGN